MSYNNYGSGYGSYGQDDSYRPAGYQDPYTGYESYSGYGQSYPTGYGSNNEPTGYVGSDPYATGYGAPQGGYGQMQPMQPAYAGQYINYQYDAMHPPRPSVGMGTAISLFFKNYANFYGRASRSEFWFASLAFGILSALFMTLFVAVAMVSGSSDTSSGALLVLMMLFYGGALAVAVPNYAITVRRLHDAGFSGFMALISLVPYVGWIAPVVMCCLPSKPEGIKYDNPNGTQPAVA